MDVDAAVGKIIGMVMAYAVSFLGLLLAYYNHRTRAGKPGPRPGLPTRTIAERLPGVEHPGERPVSPVAEGEGAVLPHPRPWLVMGAAATVLVLAAAAVSGDHPGPAAAILAQWPGIAVPGAVFAVSFWVTWALYRKFSAGPAK